MFVFLFFVFCFCFEWNNVADLFPTRGRAAQFLTSIIYRLYLKKVDYPKTIDWKGTVSFHWINVYWFQYSLMHKDKMHRMKILLSVSWNISEYPLNAHGMFTEIQISGIVQWPFSGHSVPLNAAEWQAHFSDHSIIFLLISGEKIQNLSIR